MGKNAVKGKKPNSLLIIGFRILIFAALVTMTALLIRPLQLNLRAQMERIRDNYISRIEEYWGRKIYYGSMEPSIFGILDIRDLQVLREDDSVLLSVSRLRFSYSLLDLLFGNIQDVFRSVRIDHPVLSWSFEKDRDLLERFSAYREESQSNSQVPVEADEAQLNFRDYLPEDFTFRIWNGEWEINHSRGKFALYGVQLDVSVFRNQVNFQGRWDAETSFALQNEKSFLNFQADEGSQISSLQAYMSGRINGEYSDDSGDGSASVSINSLYGDLFKFNPITVSFFLSNERLEVRKTHDKSPVAISVVYDLESGALQGYFESENFSADDLFVFTGPWKDYNNFLTFRLTGRAGFTKRQSNGFSYNLDFAGLLPADVMSAPASLLLKAEGESNRLQVDTLYINSSFGYLNFNGGMDLKPSPPNQDGFTPIAAYGDLSLSNFRVRGNDGISGELSISTLGREILIKGKNITSGAAFLSFLDCSIYQEKQGLSLAFAAGDNQKSKINLEASVDYDPGYINASLMLDSFTIGDILSFSEPVALLPTLPSLVRSVANDISVSTEVFFTTDYEHMLYNAPNMLVSFNSLGKVTAGVSLSGTNNRFELQDGIISWEDGSADIYCSVDFTNPNDITFSLGASYVDLTYFLEGMILDKQSVSVMGSYGFQAFLSADKNGSFSAFAEGNNIPLPSGDHYASLSLFISLYYNSPALWHLNIEKFDLSGITTPSSSMASLRFTGVGSDKGFTIPDLFYDDGKGPLAGSILVNFDNDYSDIRFALDVFGTATVETYRVYGNYENNIFELDASILGMQLSRFTKLAAVADLGLHLVWESFESFEAEAALPVLVIYQQEGEMRISADASANSKEFTLKQLKINYSGLDVLVPLLTINLDESRMETELAINGNLSGRQVNAAIQGESRFDSVDTWLDMLRGFGSLDGSLTVSNARYDTMFAEDPFAFVFSARQEAGGLSLSVNGGPRDMLRFLYTPEKSGGNFYAALSAPFPVRGSFTGYLDSEYIDAQGTDIYVDLGVLWKFIPPNDTIEFPNGIVTAAIRVQGPLRDPEFFGFARGTSIQILVPEYVKSPIRPLPVNVVLDGSEMRFGPVDAIVGQGMGKASGWFRFEGWIPNIFTIDVQVPHESPVPYGLNVSGVIADGLVSGKLAIAMEDLILYVDGDFTASNTEISLNSNEFGASEGGDSSPSDKKISTIVNISIRSGRRVEFFWPTYDFPILQATADLGTGIRVSSDTVARRFSLIGDLKLRSGEIFYLERNFYLREGTLFFNETESDFDPRITARAEIRDQIDTGPVTISLIIDPSPLKSFTTRFVSSPPLSQVEIYSLLGQNPQGDAAGNQLNVATSAIFDSLTQFTVMRRVQRQARDFLGLDMLSMRTQLLQNAITQATGWSTSDKTSESRYRIGNYFDNSTVFIGKYFGANIFGEAMFSLRYDEDTVNWGGVKLESEIGLEMRNPLFDIRFNISPLHPENMFIDDVSFSVIWRRTF